MPDSVGPRTPLDSVRRLRDLTYSAPVYVDVRYTKGGGVQTASHIQIGRIPIMLRSCKCILAGMSEAQLERAKECVFDPGGYFIVKGVEKVRGRGEGVRVAGEE